MFFVRHAQSTWNRHLEDLRRAPQILSDMSQAKPALQGAMALTREISGALLQDGQHTDHKLSELGETQAKELADRLVAQEQDVADAAERVFYQQLFSESPSIFCSPMLRAVQTAHLALPTKAGWGQLVLLKDAREVFSNWAERDCVGVAEGRGIVERAMSECDLPGLADRVDWSRSDCEQGRWWSDEVEVEDVVNERLDALLRKLLDEEESRSCICVTHSNLIRRLLMRYGAVGSGGGGGAGVARQLPGSEPSSARDMSLSCASDASWVEVDCTPTMLQRCKVEKLQNCGCLGVHFIKEEERWAARDVCMMFGTKLEQDLWTSAVH